MNIRSAVPNDAHRFLEIHRRSIQALCQADYTAGQIEAWVNFRTVDDFRQRILRDVNFVAEIDSRVVGYIRYSPKNNELCSLHVDPDYARRGVGTALFRQVARDARERNITHLWLHASLNAVPFYRSLGFSTGRQAVHMLGDVGLACVEMSIHFTGV